MNYFTIGFLSVLALYVTYKGFKEMIQTIRQECGE